MQIVTMVGINLSVQMSQEEIEKLVVKASKFTKSPLFRIHETKTGEYIMGRIVNQCDGGRVGLYDTAWLLQSQHNTHKDLAHFGLQDKFTATELNVYVFELF